jgi:hypothetical protein
MAQTPTEKSNLKLVKVRALQPLACVGFAHFEGDELEVSSELASVWLELEVVEVV